MRGRCVRPSTIPAAPPSARRSGRRSPAPARAPVAVRTLELLAEAAAAPDADGSGIRILDRHGAGRLRGDTSEPMTLADLVAELQERHPGLFLPPEPEPAPQVEEPRDSALLSGAYEMKAATARFVETQSERARSLAERSSVQGRVLAQNAAGRFATLRTSLRGRFARPADAVSDGTGAADAARQADPVEAWNTGPGRLGDTVRDGLETLRDRLGFGRDIGDEGANRQRRWLTGASVAALVAVIAAGLVPGGPPARNRAPRHHRAAAIPGDRAQGRRPGRPCGPAGRDAGRPRYGHPAPRDRRRRRARCDPARLRTP